MAKSRFLWCTRWAPSRAGPGDHYKPGRPQTIPAAPEENQLGMARGGVRDLKNIMGAVGQTYLTHAARKQIQNEKASLKLCLDKVQSDTPWKLKTKLCSGRSLTISHADGCVHSPAPFWLQITEIRCQKACRNWCLRIRPFTLSVGIKVSCTK